VTSVPESPSLYSTIPSPVAKRAAVQQHVELTYLIVGLMKVVMRTAALSSADATVTFDVAYTAAANPKITMVSCKSPSRMARISYRLDNIFASQPEAKYYLLIALTGVLVFCGAWVYTLVASSGGETLGAAMWIAWKAVSAGDDAPDESLIGRFVNTMMVIAGMIVMATLFGLIDESMGNKVQELKKGKSTVIEEGHSILLNWNDKLLPVAEQIAMANDSDGGRPIVILAERPKEEMDDEVADSGIDWKGSEVVTRTGSSMIVSDLAKLSIQTARSVIVFTDNSLPPDEADALSIRTCLALRALTPLAGHVVLELQDIDNVDIVRIGIDSSGVQLVPLVAHDIIGRLMIQCARQPGLAFVFANILQFDGSEVYIKAWPQLTGKSLQDAIFMFEDAIVIGVKREDFMADGSHVVMNPPMNYLFELGDELIVLAEDDDSYAPGPLVDATSPEPMQLVLEGDRIPESILFCGWRRDLEDMLSELDKWVATGTRLTLLSGVSIEEREELLSRPRNSNVATGTGKASGSRFTNLSVHHVCGNPVLRESLLKLPMVSFDSVIILSDALWVGDGMSCDSRVLVAMLLCKDILRKLGRESVPIVSEILDPRTKQLVALSGCSEYVVSSELISMCLAQCSESRDMEYILQGIFSEEGSELHCKDVRLFCDENEVLSFWELQKRATDLQDENGVAVIIIGYRNEDHKGEEFYLNPHDKHKKITWKTGDLVAVISVD